MALPLATVVVGAYHGGGGSGGGGADRGRLTASVVTTCAPRNDPPARCEFEFGSGSGLAYEEAARPKWANYVKGVVANFHGSVANSFSAAIVSSVPLGLRQIKSTPLLLLSHNLAISLSMRRRRALQFRIAGGGLLHVSGVSGSRPVRRPAGEGAGVPEGGARIRSDAMRNNGPVHRRHGRGGVSEGAREEMRKLGMRRHPKFVLMFYYHTLCSFLYCSQTRR